MMRSLSAVSGTLLVPCVYEVRIVYVCVCEWVCVHVCAAMLCLLSLQCRVAHSIYTALLLCLLVFWSHLAITFTVPPPPLSLSQIMLELGFSHRAALLASFFTIFGKFNPIFCSQLQSLPIPFFLSRFFRQLVGDPESCHHAWLLPHLLHLSLHPLLSQVLPQEAQVSNLKSLTFILNHSFFCKTSVIHYTSWPCCSPPGFSILHKKLHGNGEWE